MAKNIFKQVSKAECLAAAAEGNIGICNLTSQKVEIDDEGHFVEARGHAIVGKTNPMIEVLSARGTIAVNEKKAEDSKKVFKSSKRTDTKELEVESAVEDDPAISEEEVSSKIDNV